MYEPLPWSEYRVDQPSDSSEDGPSKTRMQRKQTGCCAEAQADGVPCDDVDCSCETCERSRLTAEPKASRPRS